MYTTCILPGMDALPEVLDHQQCGRQRAVPSTRQALQSRVAASNRTFSHPARPPSVVGRGRVVARGGQVSFPSPGLHSIHRAAISGVAEWNCAMAEPRVVTLHSRPHRTIIYIYTVVYYGSIPSSATNCKVRTFPARPRPRGAMVVTTVRTRYSTHTPQSKRCGHCSMDGSVPTLPCCHCCVQEDVAYADDRRRPSWRIATGLTIHVDASDASGRRPSTVKPLGEFQR